MRKLPLIDGIHFYIDGYVRIFTEQYHLDRGYCCKGRCKNCPFKKDS